MWVFQKTQNIQETVATTIDRCLTQIFQITELCQNDTEHMVQNIKTPSAEEQACMRSMKNIGTKICYICNKSAIHITNKRINFVIQNFRNLSPVALCLHSNVSESLE